MGADNEKCWLTGEYTDMCCCDMCEHQCECSGSDVDKDD